MHYVYRCSGTVTRHLERVVEVTLTYDQLHPERVTISTVEFEDNSVDLDVEEGELTRDDDNDYSDQFDPPEDEYPEVEPPEYEPPDQEPPDYEPSEEEP